VARLHADSWRRTYRGMMRDEYLDGDVVEDRLRVWRERLTSPAANQAVFVAEADAQLAGFVCIYSDDDPRWGSLIDNLHVRHDLQKAGTGRLLMRKAADWCAAAHPGKGMYLYVMRANTNAIAFYERLGGVNVESVDHPNSAGGGTAHVFRYAWPEQQTLMM
jgi:ribosomal protein S18 acetylase RimI-like enzyme